MIDRAARNETAEAIEAFLDDRIGAFEFDDRIFNIETDDVTVQEIVYAAWFHYDDIKDHQVVLSKSGWDYFQRLLLLLRSDAEVAIKRTRRWSWDNALAWAGVALFVAVACLTGWGYHLLLVSIPFGCLSLAIYRFREQKEREIDPPTPDELACMPFDSFAQIRQLRMQVGGFEKRRYRSDLEDRCIRTDRQLAALDLWQIPVFLFWFCLAPVVLFFQTLSETDTEAEIVVTSNTAH